MFSVLGVQNLRGLTARFRSRCCVHLFVHPTRRPWLQVMTFASVASTTCGTSRPRPSQVYDPKLQPDCKPSFSLSSSFIYFQNLLRQGKLKFGQTAQEKCASPRNPSRFVSIRQCFHNSKKSSFVAKCLWGCLLVFLLRSDGRRPSVPAMARSGPRHAKWLAWEQTETAASGSLEVGRMGNEWNRNLKFFQPVSGVARL